MSLITTWRYRTRRTITHYRRFGFQNTVKYLLTAGLKKRISGRVFYLLHRNRYAQNIIFIAGFPKGGSTWIMNLFASLPGFGAYSPLKWNTTIPDKWGLQTWDLYDGVFNEFRNCYAVIRGHTRGVEPNLRIIEESNLKYLISVRDPRDRLISEYWHARNFPLQQQKKLAASMSVGEFVAYKLESGEFQEESLQWISTWLTNRNPHTALILRYEDLLHRAHFTIKSALEFMGIEVNDKFISKSIEANRFEKITGRKRGIADNSRFVRKGISGEWKDVFTPSHKAKFVEIGEDLIERLGYEPTL